jgi:hypothetical protein
MRWKCYFSQCLGRKVYLIISTFVYEMKLRLTSAPHRGCEGRHPDRRLGCHVLISHQLSTNLLGLFPPLYAQLKTIGTMSCISNADTTWPNVAAATTHWAMDAQAWRRHRRGIASNYLAWMLLCQSIKIETRYRTGASSEP